MATNFLEATGGSTVGYFSAVTTLISSELVSLASSGTATSGSIFSSSNTFSQAIWGEVLVQWGGSISPTVGGYLAGWFMRSPDGGTTFESTTGATLGMPRNPDFIIPLSTTYANTNVAYGGGLVRMPWSAYKLIIFNASGVTLPSSATAYTAIKIGPVAVQY